MSVPVGAEGPISLSEEMMVTEGKEGQDGNYSDFRLRTWEGRVLFLEMESHDGGSSCC